MASWAVDPDLCPPPEANEGGHAMITFFNATYHMLRFSLVGAAVEGAYFQEKVGNHTNPEMALRRIGKVAGTTGLEHLRLAGSAVRASPTNALNASPNRAAPRLTPSRVCPLREPAHLRSPRGARDAHIQH